MSEANLPPRHPAHDSSEGDAPVERVHWGPSEQEAPSASSDTWEPVPLPGTLPGQVAASTASADPAATAQQPKTEREAELITLVQDLNRCNEVLLSRVHQLESALAASQKALQQQIERSQRLTEEERVAMAQRQSVAQLLSELDSANAALKRQTILAETLQAQLDNAQEQTATLERECARLQKRYAEKAQQAQQLEETCRDLRSRLQRQQRYTLQFKAALEKSLDATTFHQTSARIQHEAAPSEVPAAASGGLHPSVMPRSERIQPWSATTDAAQADAQLLSLARSLKQPDSNPVAPVAQSSAAPPPSPVDSDAEQQLWQDVERVLDDSATAAPAAAAASDQAAEDAQPSPPTAQFTEPIPWGPPAAQSTPAAETAPPEAAPAARDRPAADAPRPAQSPGAFPPPLALEATEIPALGAMSTAALQTAPSPVVHPLRPTQRKRKSLSAVELPSFPPLPKPPH